MPTGKFQGPEDRRGLQRRRKDRRAEARAEARLFWLLWMVGILNFTDAAQTVYLLNARFMVEAASGSTPAEWLEVAAADAPARAEARPQLSMHRAIWNCTTKRPTRKFISSESTRWTNRRRLIHQSE